MPSWVAHAVAGVAVASVFTTRTDVRRFAWTAAACTIVPDLDAIGWPIGMGDIELLGGHRGFTHSIPFAVLLGAAAAWGIFRGERWKPLRLRLWLCFALATMTHGALDALSTIGEGVRFFSPFRDTRYVSAWQPLHASRAPPEARPVSRIAYIVRDEMQYVILPCVILIVIVSRGRGTEARPGRRPGVV